MKSSKEKVDYGKGIKEGFIAFFNVFKSKSCCDDDKDVDIKLEEGKKKDVKKESNSVEKKEPVVVNDASKGQAEKKVAEKKSAPKLK